MFTAALLLQLMVPELHAAREPVTPQEKLEKGKRHAKRGYYVKALEEFNEIRSLYRDDPISLAAELAIADVYYQKGEWDQARVAYSDFSRLHPRHPDLDYVTWRIGLTSYQKAPRWAGRDQIWTRQALSAWAGFSRRFPDSEHLEEVTEASEECRSRLALKELQIAEFYAQREAWPATIARLEGQLQRYPETEWTPRSLALLSQSYLASGENDKAQSTLDRLRSDYPDSKASKKAGSLP